MNKSSDEHPRSGSLESRVQPLDDGEECPPFKSQLFALADAVIAKRLLDDEQQMLMRHIDNCHMCRSIYRGAIYFSQDESEVQSANVANEIMREMADDPVRKLKTVQGRCENQPMPNSEYFQELAYAAGLSKEVAFKALGLPECTPLSDLDVQAKPALYVLTMIGKPDREAVSRFRFSRANQYSVCSTFRARVVALRAAVPQGSGSGDVVSMLNALVRESGVDMESTDQEIAGMGFEL